MLNWFARRLAETGKEVRKDQRGFTLIELLVVVIIIGILAAIAIPVFLSQRDNAEDRAAESNVRTAGTAEQVAFTETGSFVPVADLGPYGFNVGGVDPPVTGVGITATSYCVQSVGATATYSMADDQGAPVDTAC